MSVCLADSVGAPLTYSEVGATARGEVPCGYTRLEHVAVVGQGWAAWERLARALVGWELHRKAGMVVAADRLDAQVGCTVVNAALVGPVGLLAPCRVVDVVDEPGRRGFAYGTLPRHPLVGEEQFTAELRSDGRAELRIRSFSRPRGLARAASSAARAGQRMVNRRYLAAALRIAA